MGKVPFWLVRIRSALSFDPGDRVGRQYAEAALRPASARAWQPPVRSIPVGLPGVLASG
jgi:hypothetical protein